MPMKNISTLIYFVNYFQKDLDLNYPQDVNVNFESYLTTMENTESVPSEKSIENILDFARVYDVVETENAGYVEMILN
jgi:hypothetical protein